MKIQINVNLEIPRWVRNIGLVLAPAGLLVTTAVVYADVPNKFQDGDTLSAQELNDDFANIDSRLKQLEGPKQIKVGDAQTVVGKRTNSSFGPFDNGNPTVSITAAASGYYRVYGTFMLDQSGGCNTGARIGHIGNAPMYVHQPVVAGPGFNLPQDGINISLLVEAVVNLQAGQTYTFQLEGSAGGCMVLNLRNDIMATLFSVGQSLVAEQL